VKAMESSEQEIAERLRVRAQDRLQQSNCKNEVYQEYIISVIIRHKNTPKAIERISKYLRGSFRARFFRWDAVKFFKIFVGKTRLPAEAALEDDWLKM
jgi:hypothetical protein